MGISAAIGAVAALHGWWIALFILLFTPSRLAIIVCAATALTTQMRFDLPDLPEDGIPYEGVFRITSLTYSHNSYMAAYVYKGTLLNGKQTPITVYLKADAGYNRPAADQDWYIAGTLRKNTSGAYIFKTQKEIPWIPIKNTHNLAEWRYGAKQSVKQFINNHCSQTKTAEFLGGLVTGDFDDKLLQFELTRFGVQHIMAISGFHFNILTACLLFVLRLFMPIRIAISASMLSLLGYFVFLGPGPSILRACSTILIGQLGTLLRRESTGANLLGITCLILIAYDPLLTLSTGFIFSAVTTASIVLFYEPLNSYLLRWFPMRFFSEMHATSYVNQIAYFSTNLLRQAIALSVAVNISALPLTLYFFKKFSLIGLLFNLFFPFFAAIALMLLIICLALPFLFPVLDAFTHFVLQLTCNLTTIFDTTVSYHPKPLLVGLYLWLLFVVKYFLSLKKIPLFRQNALAHGDRSSVG